MEVRSRRMCLSEHKAQHGEELKETLAGEHDHGAKVDPTEEIGEVAVVSAATALHTSISGLQRQTNSDGVGLTTFVASLPIPRSYPASS